MKGGHLALRVDRFGMRGHSSICDNAALLYDLPLQRAPDAQGAKSDLAGLLFAEIPWSVRKRRIIIR